MRKFLLSMLLLLGISGAAFAQSDVVVFTTNPTMEYEPGETMSFTIMITNNGPDAAANVFVSFPIPSGITIPVGITKFWWTGSNGSSGTNVNLNNTIPSLAVNQTVTYTVNVKIPNDYNLTIPQPTVTWKTQSDIEVINTDNQAVYTPGSTVQYTVTVINHGPEATTTGVQVSNAIPAGVTNYQWTDTDGANYTFAMIANTGILSVGEEVTYTVSFTVPAAFTGNLTNAVTYIANVVDPTPGCTQCSDTDVPATGANIVVTTTDNSLTYTPGSPSVYTVTVTNQGPNAATNVNVSVPVPTGITSFTWTGSNTSSGTGALANTIPALAVGASVTYTVTVGVPAAYTGALTVQASTTSTPTDPDTSCTLCADTDYDAVSANIVTTKTLEGGNTYTAGANAIYTITVNNQGPGAAQNVVVSDLVPAGFDAASASWTSSTGAAGTGNLSDTIELLLANTTVTYNFSVPVPSNYSQTANLVNTATVTSDTPDPNMANNTATHTATPNPQANIVTLKTNFQAQYVVNSNTVYTITVTNPGPSDAYNIVVNDNKPYYINVMSWSGSNDSGGSGSLNNVIPVLPAGQSVTYTVQIFIPEDYATFVGSLTNTVTVTSSTPDPVPACPGCIDTDTPAGNFVTTSDNEYTIPELVEDVLIDVNCVGISNVTWSTGTNYGTTNGIAYFKKNNSTFPIKEGVVLTCGNAVPSPGVPGVDGPNLTGLSNSGWPGDTELTAYAPGINNDASWIKFNFVPVSDSFSFNYLFASEEYDNCSFQCNYSDVFAFILKDLETNVTQNLAVLPTTPPVNVLVTTVHPATPCGCAAANVTYFGQYNLAPNAATAPINFNGQTVVLTAVGTVVPNHEYSIKLVIANGGDHAYNSAVFIEGGSFDIGQPTLPGDITLGNQALLLCYGDTYMLESNASNPEMLVKWQKDGEWMFEEDGVTFIDEETIPITEPGTYTVMGYFASNPDCFLSDDIIIDFNPEINPADPEDLTICDDPAVANDTWDLSENTPIVLAAFNEPDNYYVSYYTNMDDIVDGEPGIWPEVTYVGQDGQVIIAMIQDMQTLCYVTRTFTLHKNPQPQSGEPDDMFACDTDNNGTEVFDLTTQDDTILDGQDAAVYAVTYHLTANDAQYGTAEITTADAFTSAGQTIYVRLTNINAPDCFDVTQFDLIVTPLPVIEPVDDVEACDVYALPALTSGNYFNQPNGVSPITNLNLTDSQIVYIFDQEGTAPNVCSAETSFEVTIYETPIVSTPANIAVCDSYMLPALTVGQYYTGPGGTGDEVAQLTEITTTTTLYIYAVSGSDATVCSDEHQFTITVNYAPVVGTATPLEECDADNNGYALFNLTEAGAEVIGSQTGLEVTYHATPEDAQFGDNDITTPTAWQNAQQEDFDDAEHPIAYIRVITAGTTTNCATVVPVTLIVHPRPEISPISDYILCDDNNSPDGVEVFDLTTKNAEATNDTTDTVSYYLTQDAAGTGTGAITAPDSFESATAEIWVRVENAFGCWQVAPIQLTVNPLPVIATNMEPFYACEETPGVGIFNFDEIDPVVTQGAAGYTVAYYLTEDQAWAGNDDYLVSEYPSATATIYARVEDAVTGCAIVSPIALEVLPAPIAPQPEPLQECDPNNDGIATFDLTETIAAIQAALGNTIVVTVHETPEDADFGTNIVTNTSSYTNNAQIWTQTLWLRVESSQTECFDVVALQLIVNPVPEATEPAGPYEMCDNGSNDTDGIAVFNLTDYAPVVLGALDPAQYSVSYFTTYNNAASNTSPIPAPASYNSISVPAIFIKVTNNATGCYDIVELELIVNPLPVANQPTPLTLCDENNPGDETEVFDLTTKIDEITGGAFGVTVTFHDTYAQAVGNTDAITTPDAYPNATPAVETIFVRVTDNETGCYRIVLLDVRVEPLPVLVAPTEAELTGCDTNNQGYAQFDLTALVEDMINNGVGITVAFYETEQNALDGILPIPNPATYTNAIAFEQTIYVVASSANGCQSQVYALTLHVEGAPQAPDLADIVLCDDQDTNNQNGQAFIDLTLYEQDIYAATGAAAGSLTIHYFTTEANADAGAPRITTPAHYNASHNQQIWVRVEMTDTGCYSLSDFTVKFNLPVAVVTPTMLVKCDDTAPINDARATFDLTQKDNEILGPLGIGLGNTVAYYATQADRDNNNPVPDATAYLNPAGQNPKTLFVKVTTPQGCVSFTTLTVKVLPIPVADTTPDALELCDTNNTGDNVESFDLTQAEDDIAANDDTVTFTYYPTQADAMAEPPTNEILPATAYVSGTGSVWVRVSANNGNATDPVCYTVVELPLVVHPLPAQGTIAPYAICEQATDGFATFDLGSRIPLILGPDANPDDYTVTFRYNGNLISYTYTNVVAGSQAIDVTVVHDETGCNTTVQLTLLVEEQAIAYAVTTPDFDLCDTDGDNDGELIIDLTQATADIIGVQDPAIHSVTYYTSQADAEAQTNPIATPATFSATTQTIWAEIINTSTVSGCPDYTSFEVIIELLPEPEISTQDDVRTICVDFDTQEVLRPLELRSGVAPNGHTYDWYLDGALVGTTTDGTYLAEAPGTYTVIVTGPAPNNCVSDESEGFTVIQSGPASPIGIGYTVSNAFGDSQVITVLVEGYGEYQYSLYEEGPWQNSNVFTDVAPGAHTVFVRDVTEDACDTLVLDEVSIINYPHYFTPNADGYNDTWNVIGLAGEQYQAIVYIFDRYGKLIKQISPDGEGWDGTYNGARMPADDYWFTVEFTEGLNRREFKAHFAMKR